MYTTTIIEIESTLVGKVCIGIKFGNTFVHLFLLMLYVDSTTFKPCRGDALYSWIENVLSGG